VSGAYYLLSLRRRENNFPKKGVGKDQSVPYLLLVKPAYVYRRRRIAALFIVAVVSSVLYAGTWADAEQPPISHTVVPGDTLWSVAIDYYPPSEDPRVAIEAIRQANGMEDRRIHPGQRLELPPANP
jgi:LysM repeat protein